MSSTDKELNKKKTHILMLLMLAEADNVDHDLELVFISKVASRLGVSDAEVAHLDQNPQNITFTIPKAEHKRMEILYDLLFLMKFDQHVDEQEIELIHRLAFRMGFRPTMTQEMIEVMKQHIGKLVPKNILLNIVKKYMN